ncbi:MAG UNVERIFIED_CONTAM: fumarylacetoacetate hydrolase family protein [Anaerolineae bacterium]
MTKVTTSPIAQKLVIKGIYNGEVCAHSNTADMIFSVAEAIAWTSALALLQLEGRQHHFYRTRRGEHSGQKPQQWMKVMKTFILSRFVGIGQLVKSDGCTMSQICNRFNGLGIGAWVMSALVSAAGAKRSSASPTTSARIGSRSSMLAHARGANRNHLHQGGIRPTPLQVTATVL